MIQVPIVSLAPSHRPVAAPKPRHWKGGRKQATHCKRNHPLSGDNLYLHPKGHRQCMICRRLYDANRWDRKATGKTHPWEAHAHGF